MAFYTSINDTRRAAERYLRAGLAVIPVPAGEKNPNRQGWQKERHTVEDIPHLWSDGQGVGILWGEPSGGMVDLDLDWPEARVAASYILPSTRTFGRAGAHESHRVYRVTDTIPKTTRYKIGGDGDGRSVAELLSTGAQSLVPPSLHASGERRQWYQERPAAEVEGSTMIEGVADSTTAALIARNWPGKGARHDYVLAACGYVGRHLARERASRVMEAAIAASGDEEARGRLADVRSTLDNLEAGNPTTGGPTLETLAPGVVDQLQRWHGWSRRGTQATPKEPETEESVGIIKLLADAITAEDHFARDAGDKLYRFSGGCYRQYAERYIRRRVKELLEAWGKADKWSSHKASEVAEYIRADASELWERPPVGEVNVANGILDLKTRVLRSHDPGYLSQIQIPVRHDPGAECPAWDKFISEVFPEDAQDLAFELAADLITPSRSTQKALLLLGEGSNGKSTYLRALTAFVGSTNSAGVSLHKLESDRFATARLIGKLANICPDLPSTHLTETSVFKAITGGDKLHAEYKYRESFEFEPYCRLVFSANHVPRSSDASHAFFRRWLVVPFNRSFEPAEQVPREELDARLSDPSELSGVLNRALAVLPRVRHKGFTESESMREAWEEFKTMTDPVSVWLDRYTITAVKAFVAKGTLLAAYNEHCEQQGRAGMTATAFGLALKRARPGLEDAQRTVGGKPRVKVWIGIGLRGPDDPPEEVPPGSGTDGGDLPDEERNPRNPVNPVSPSVSDSDKQYENNAGTMQDAGSNNRGNWVNPVTSVTAQRGNGWYAEKTERKYWSAAEMLENPPPWLAQQLAQFQADPERWLRPTASAMSKELYGTYERTDKVIPVLNAYLEQPEEEDYVEL